MSTGHWSESPLCAEDASQARQVYSTDLSLLSVCAKCIHFVVPAIWLLLFNLTSLPSSAHLGRAPLHTHSAHGCSLRGLPCSQVDFLGWSEVFLLTLRSLLTSCGGEGQGQRNQNITVAPWREFVLKPRACICSYKL